MWYRTVSLWIGLWSSGELGRGKSEKGSLPPPFPRYFFPKQRACSQANVSVKSKLQHAPPPPSNPPGIWLFWKLLFKFSATRTKMPFKFPTLGSIQVIKWPHRGDISQAQKWQKDGGNRCYKVTECSAFLCHATSKAFYKNWSHLLKLLHHDHFIDMHHRSPYYLHTYSRSK